MSNFRQAETPYGIMTGFQDDLITQFLDRYGEWAPFETAIARTVVKPGDVIVDAGAFIGTFSISMLGAKPSKICAIDANPASFEVLHYNAAQLGGERIVALHGALGIWPGHDGTPETPVYGKGNRGSATFIGGAADTAQPNTETPKTVVPPLTLPEVRAAYGDYALAKLDLEGCELMALKGDHDYLASAKPFLLIEANPTEQTAQIANYCRMLGYETYFASLPVWRKHNPKSARDAIFPLSHEGALLACAPGTLPDMPRELFSNGGSIVQVEDTTQLIDALWRTPTWSTQEWMDMSKEELIAVIGRLSQGETRADFQVRLYPSAPIGPDLPTPQ